MIFSEPVSTVRDSCSESGAYSSATKVRPLVEAPQCDAGPARQSKVSNDDGRPGSSRAAWLLLGSPPSFSAPWLDRAAERGQATAQKTLEDRRAPATALCSGLDDGGAASPVPD